MRTILLFVVMIGLTVAANLLMKVGATSIVSGGGWACYLNWKLLSGLLCFALASLVYIVILKTLPLNVAQAFASVQFIAVILASSLILSEPIGMVRCAGIILIAIGIAIVSWST